MLAPPGGTGFVATASLSLHVSFKGHVFALFSPALKKQVCLCRFKVTLNRLDKIFPFLFSSFFCSCIDPGLSTGAQYAGCVCTFLQIDNRGSLFYRNRLCYDEPGPRGWPATSSPLRFWCLEDFHLNSFPQLGLAPLWPYLECIPAIVGETIPEE